MASGPPKRSLFRSPADLSDTTEALSSWPRRAAPAHIGIGDEALVPARKVDRFVDRAATAGFRGRFVPGAAERGPGPFDSHVDIGTVSASPTNSCVAPWRASKH